jgi:hypothetical protein
MRKTIFIIVAGAASMGILAAQDLQRRASIVRGGVAGGGDGCTVDVIVDGAAEVQIRGDSAVMRNLGGSPPQIRQFECTRPMPPDAPGFRFNQVDGRGRQELVRTPQGGGPAVVRIDDPQGGAGEYRFEITWYGDRGGDRRGQGDRGYDQSRNQGDRGYDQDRDHAQYQSDRDRFFQGEAWRGNLFQRVREDVEHVQRSTFPFTGDQSRLSRTILELNELQGKLSAGRYDEHELGDVMEALTWVLQSNRLSPRDRDVLTDDLNRMREYREHHEQPDRDRDRDRRN